MNLAEFSIEQLADRAGQTWPAIMEAKSDAEQHADKLRAIVAELKPSPDVAVVAFGSLAREEWTSGSDVDWTLLIDGPADMRHFDMARAVEEALQENKYREPGPTGTFGDWSGSHELVHHIGGGEDTNQNITRRVLLLLESVSLSDELPHHRVIKAILERYILGDPPATSPPRLHTPLFLLNDIVRYWRTIAVDYAAKKWQRSNAGWALRNAKLRMSRKLLFAKGLLTCFLCDEEFAGEANPETADLDLLNHCFDLSRCPAIHLLAWTVFNFASDEVARKLFGSYDQFLATLNDNEKRDHLKKLEFGAQDDALFNEQRQLNRDFRDGLDALFFESHERLTHLTRRYGVF
ncbi:MAG: nucleotidyltransferase domain-containing protein [Pirellulaceae bacterium]